MRRLGPEATWLVWALTLVVLLLLLVRGDPVAGVG